MPFPAARPGRLLCLTLAVLLPAPAQARAAAAPARPPRAELALAARLRRTVLDPGFVVRVVRVGRLQNYWSLARSAGVDLDTLVGFNPDLRDLRSRSGRWLLLPNRRGCLYRVRPGDRLPVLERRFGLKPGTLEASDRVSWLGPEPGDVLFLPDRRPVQLTPPMRALYAERAFFVCPLRGRLSSFYGMRKDPFTGEPRFHKGIDIAAPLNDPVVAAAAGRVVLAGWDDGFGRRVVIVHADGYRTSYAHLNVILVRCGQRVRRGRRIGLVGTTGRATGPHLFFSLWKDGRLQNPLDYLW